MAFFGLFGLKEDYFYSFNVHEGPGKVVAFLDGLKSCTFFGEARGSV